MNDERTGTSDGRRLDFRLERTEKADGRYVLFYSWPDRARAAAREDGEATAETPEQLPSSPETDPTRV
jgi:hypothetical protein